MLLRKLFPLVLALCLVPLVAAENESDNRTYIPFNDTIEINATGYWYWYILMDPAGIIGRNFHQADFNIQPTKILGDRIVWKIRPNDTTVLLTYNFNQELQQLLRENNATVIESFVEEEPSAFEKWFHKARPDSKMYLTEKLEKMIKTSLVLISLVIVTLLFFVIKSSKREKQEN